MLPLLAGTEFGLTSETAAIGFLVAFGFAKAGANFLAGDLAERIGRRRILLAAALLGRAVTFFVRDTGHYVQLEAELSDSAPEPLGGSHARKPLLTANQAGLLTNLKEGVAWGLLPVFFADQGLELRQIAWLAALYPAVWGLTQLGTGTLSDSIGRRPLIVGGLLVQVVALAGFATLNGFVPWAACAVTLGIGTAAVYPTLIAQVGDLVVPETRETRARASEMLALLEKAAKVMDEVKDIDG